MIVFLIGRLFFPSIAHYSSRLVLSPVSCQDALVPAGEYGGAGQQRRLRPAKPGQTLPLCIYRSYTVQQCLIHRSALSRALRLFVFLDPHLSKITYMTPCSLLLCPAGSGPHQRPGEQLWGPLWGAGGQWRLPPDQPGHAISTVRELWGGARRRRGTNFFKIIQI